MKKFIGHSASVSHVIFNPYGNLIISGSKDNTVKFWDITSGLCIKTYSTYLGYPAFALLLMPLMAIGVLTTVLQTISSEVTSVAMSHNGSLLLTSSKDNSNRLWDVRMVRGLLKMSADGHVFLNASSLSTRRDPSGGSRGTRTHPRTSFALPLGQTNPLLSARPRFIRRPRPLTVVGSHLARGQDELIYIWDIMTGDLLQTLKGHTGTVYTATWNPYQSLLARHDLLHEPPP